MELKKVKEEEFKELLALSMTNPTEAEYLGKKNWEQYLNGLTEELESGVFVVYEDGKAIGYAVACPNEDDWVYLSEVFIKKEYRGKGLGEAVLREILKVFGCHHIHAYVHENNNAMQKVLLRLGGKAAGKWYDYAT